MANSSHPDPARLRELAHRWRQLAYNIEHLMQTGSDAVVGVDWSGRGRDRAVAAMTALVLRGNKMRDDLNARADELDRIAEQVEKQLEAEKLALILFGIFFVVGLVLGFVLGPVVGALGGVFAGLLVRFVSAEIAELVGLFASGFVVFGALGLALDLTAAGIVAAKTGEFHYDGINALILLVGAFVGGLMPGGRIPRVGPLGGAKPKTVTNHVTGKTYDVALSGGLKPSNPVTLDGGPRPGPPSLRPGGGDDLGVMPGRPGPAPNGLDGPLGPPKPTPKPSVESFSSRTDTPPIPVTGGGAKLVGRPAAETPGTIAPPVTIPRPVTRAPGGGAPGPDNRVTAPPLRSGTDVEIPPSSSRPRTAPPVERPPLSHDGPGNLPKVPKGLQHGPGDGGLPNTAGPRPGPNLPGPRPGPTLPGIRPEPELPGARPGPELPGPAPHTPPKDPLAGRLPLQRPGESGPVDPFAGRPLGDPVNGSPHNGPQSPVARTPSGGHHRPPSLRLPGGPEAGPGLPRVEPHADPVAGPPGVDPVHGLPHNGPQSPVGRTPSGGHHRPPSLRLPGGGEPPRAGVPELVRPPSPNPLGSGGPAEVVVPPNTRPVTGDTGAAPPAVPRGRVGGTELPRSPSAHSFDTVVETPSATPRPGTPDSTTPLLEPAPRHDGTAGAGGHHGPPRLRQPLPDLPVGARRTPDGIHEKTWVSVDGGRVWTQAPGKPSSAAFDEIRSHLHAAGRTPPGSDLVLARDMRFPGADGEHHTEYFRYSGRGWTLSPEPPPQARFPGTKVLGPSEYPNLINPEAPNPAALQWHETAMRQPGGAAVPTNVDRYHLSRDGGATWERFDRPGETPDAVRQRLQHELATSGHPDDHVVAFVKLGLKPGDQTTFTIGPEGWKLQSDSVHAPQARHSSPDAMPTAVRRVEVLQLERAPDGSHTTRWRPIERYADGDSTAPRPITARDIEEHLGFTGPRSTGGERFRVRMTETATTQADVRLFQWDGAHLRATAPQSLPRLGRDGGLGIPGADPAASHAPGPHATSASSLQGSPAARGRTGQPGNDAPGGGTARRSSPPNPDDVTTSPIVFRVEVPPVRLSDLPSLAGPVRKDSTVPVANRGRTDDPELPRYSEIAHDKPPQRIDGQDYSLLYPMTDKPLGKDLFVMKEPARPELTPLREPKRPNEGLDAEIDRVRAERRDAVEHATGGGPRAEQPRTPPDPGHEAEPAPIEPSLRHRAIDALGRDADNVVVSQVIRAGGRLAAGDGGVPGGTVGGSPGRSYETIRDELLARSADGAGASRLRQYVRKLNLGELRNGLDATVHERRDLLAAGGTGDAERLRRLDRAEAALHGAWTDRLGVPPAPAPVTTRPKPAGRAGIEHELRRIVQDRRRAFVEHPPGEVRDRVVQRLHVAEAEALAQVPAARRAELRADLRHLRREQAEAQRELTAVVESQADPAGAASVGEARRRYVELRRMAESLDRALRENTANLRRLRGGGADGQPLPDWARSAGTARSAPPVETPPLTKPPVSAEAVTKPPVSAEGEANPPATAKPVTPAVPEPVAAEPRSEAELRLERMLQAAAGAGKVEVRGHTVLLRGPRPDGQPEPPSLMGVARSAPGSGGALRVFPDAEALPGLQRFLRSLPAQQRYHVIVDLRLVPDGTALPFDPAAFARRNFVFVDQPMPAVADPDPAHGFPVGLDRQRTIAPFADAYRWAPTARHVPEAPTQLLPKLAPLWDLPVGSSAYHWPMPTRETPSRRFNPIAAYRDVTGPAERTTFPLSDGWHGIVTGNAVWLGPADRATPPPAVTEHAAASAQPKLFVGDAGLDVPDSVWDLLGELFQRLSRDAAGGLDFEPLGLPTPPPQVQRGPDGLPTPVALRAKIDALAADVAAAPGPDTIATALQSLTDFAWTGHLEGLPAPTVLLRPTGQHAVTGHFDHITWTVSLPLPAAETLDAWTYGSWLDLATRTVHELVHADQYTKIARALARDHDTVEGLAALLPIQDRAVLEAAVAHPFAAGSPELTEGLALHDSVGPHGTGSDELLARLRELWDRYTRLQRERPDAGAELAELYVEYQAARQEYERLAHESPAIALERQVRYPHLALRPASPKPVAEPDAVVWRQLEGLPPLAGRGADGEHLTGLLGPALAELAQTGHTDVEPLAEQWNAMVDEAGPRPGRDALERMLTFVNEVVGRVGMPPPASAAAGTDVVGGALLGWVAQDGWAAKARYFAEHRDTLSSTAARDDFRTMFAGGAKLIGLHADVLTLAGLGHGAAAHAYLAETRRDARRGILLDLSARIADPDGLRALSRLPAAVDAKGTFHGVSFSETAFSKMAAAIADARDGDVAKAVTLARQSRRYLGGLMRVDWVMTLEALHSPALADAIQRLQETIVDCD
ncbi:hypothetical protein ABT369_25760 [Dactylosporangium sp. NPDC000244]|uniref:hypothetical protein n=1 Tax=Dactylosporangium sp. NPDC000244 TaxID=3154365 RepID=UPI003325724E